MDKLKNHKINCPKPQKNKKGNYLVNIISFILFRFFDILKPFPIGYFDKNYKNSFGILFDDVLSGVFTLVVILLLIKFF